MAGRGANAVVRFEARTLRELLFLRLRASEVPDFLSDDYNEYVYVYS